MQGEFRSYDSKRKQMAKPAKRRERLARPDDRADIGNLKRRAARREREAKGQGEIARPTANPPKRGVETVSSRPGLRAMGSGDG